MLKKYQIALFGMGMLRDKAGDDPGGGGGDPEPKEDPKDDPKPDGGGNVTLTQEQFEKLLSRAGGGKPPEDDDDLYTKNKKNQQDKDSSRDNEKSVESAIRFNLQAKDWLKENDSLLPKDIGGIFEAADKESYDSPVEKDRSIKSGIIQSFFSVQDNLDLLTASQKNQVEDWIKLTKNGKEEKAQHLYDSIFEPTFSMLKRIEKTKKLNQAGGRDSSDVEDDYKKRLIEGSQKHYMGEKANA